MNRRQPKHRLNRQTRNALALRPDQRNGRRRGLRALLTGAVGLLILTGSATGLANAAAAGEPVPTAFTGNP